MGIIFGSCFPKKPKYKLDNFEKIKCIGKGGFGQVYSCIDSAYTNKCIVLKKIQLIGPQRILYEHLFRRECDLLQSLNHKNIIKLKGFFTTDGCGYIVMKMMDGDLFKYIRSKTGGLEYDEIKMITKQVLKGLHYCHSRGIIHRDVKSNNILLCGTGPGQVKLADFGVGRNMNVNPKAPLTVPIGTVNYRAPEVLVRQVPYNFSIDIWAFSCVFAEAITGNFLFNGYGELAILCDVMDLLGTPSEQDLPAFVKSSLGQMLIPANPSTDLNKKIPKLAACPLAKQVLESILKFAPASRPTAHALLAHEFFN